MYRPPKRLHAWRIRRVRTELTASVRQYPGSQIVAGPSLAKLANSSGKSRTGKRVLARHPPMYLCSLFLGGIPFLSITETGKGNQLVHFGALTAIPVFRKDTFLAARIRLGLSFLVVQPQWPPVCSSMTRRGPRASLGAPLCLICER